MELSQYPSAENAYKFFKQAKLEYSSEDVIKKKDGCEKAYRAATEMIDVLLASKGDFIPAGDPLAHAKRSADLAKWSTVKEIRAFSRQYSEIKDMLHGACFYTSENPEIFKVIFDTVAQFLKEIETFVS